MLWIIDATCGLPDSCHVDFHFLTLKLRCVFIRLQWFRTVIIIDVPHIAHTPRLPKGRLFVDCYKWSGLPNLVVHAAKLHVRAFDEGLQPSLDMQ